MGRSVRRREREGKERNCFKQDGKKEGKEMERMELGEIR